MPPRFADKKKKIMSDWNAAQYAKFKAQRTLPAAELANALPAQGVESIIDLGCGIGNSTAVLKNRFPQAHIVGADSSDDMLDFARKNEPELEFIKLNVPDDIETLGRKFDVVYSNACLQWIPNHKELLSRLMELVNPGGTLAVQIPQQAKHPMYKLMPMVAQSGEWAEKIKYRRKYNCLTEEEYFDILSDISSDFRLWETTYFFKMPSHRSIVEWYKGTGMRPYLDGLSDEDKIKFENDVLAEVEKLYPVQKNGEIIFRFPRLFFTAIK